MLSVNIRDKIISISNKTFVDEKEIMSSAKKIKQEKNVSIDTAFRAMVNWAIDGKLKLEEIKVKRNGLPVNTITNLEDLIKNERIEERRW